MPESNEEKIVRYTEVLKEENPRNWPIKRALKRLYELAHADDTFRYFEQEKSYEFAKKFESHRSHGKYAVALLRKLRSVSKEMKPNRCLKPSMEPTKTDVGCVYINRRLEEKSCEQMPICQNQKVPSSLLYMGVISSDEEDDEKQEEKNVENQKEDSSKIETEVSDASSDDDSSDGEEYSELAKELEAQLNSPTLKEKPKTVKPSDTSNKNHRQNDYQTAKTPQLAKRTTRHDSKSVKKLENSSVASNEDDSSDGEEFSEMVRELEAQLNAPVAKEKVNMVPKTLPPPGSSSDLPDTSRKSHHRSDYQSRKFPQSHALCFLAKQTTMNSSRVRSSDEQQNSKLARELETQFNCSASKKKRIVTRVPKSSSLHNEPVELPDMFTSKKNHHRVFSGSRKTFEPLMLSSLAKEAVNANINTLCVKPYDSVENLRSVLKKFNMEQLNQLVTFNSAITEDVEHLFRKQIDIEFPEAIQLSGVTNREEYYNLKKHEAAAKESKFATLTASIMEKHTNINCSRKTAMLRDPVQKAPHNAKYRGLTVSSTPEVFSHQSVATSTSRKRPASSRKEQVKRKPPTMSPLMKSVRKEYQLIQKRKKTS